MASITSSPAVVPFTASVSTSRHALNVHNGASTSMSSTFLVPRGTLSCTEGTSLFGVSLKPVSHGRISQNPNPRRSLIVAMAPPKAGGKAKKVIGLVKLALEAGKATPAPPVGPALGAKGVNIMMFCKEYNAKTADKPGYVIPVEITVYDDKSFTFILKTPPASILLLKACGADKGSENPQKVKVGKLTPEQVRIIAEEKLPDLNCTSIESAMRIVAGTAANMGIDIDPPILQKKVKVVL